MSVTDHDTVAGLDEARVAAASASIRLINGIEITAIERGRDVHVLGYFIDPDNDALARFLQAQRESRVDRVREIAEKLRSMGLAVDVDAILAGASTCGRSVGRPALADALVAAGHATDRRDAFDRLLAAGKPAFVSRCGPSLADVTGAISEAGGIASLAHPGLNGLDEEIPRFAASGLSALEARHRDHPPEIEQHYRTLARALGLAVSGGSDFHGDAGASEDDVDPLRFGPGSVSLPSEDFAELEARLRRGQAARKHAGMH